MVNMEGHHQRPSKELVKKAYDHLLNPTFTISKLKDSALEDRLLPFAAFYGSEGSFAVILLS